MEWKLADAKNRFSEVVNLALREGPQHITRRTDRVVLLSKEDYEKLSGKKPSFKSFLLNGPSFPEDMDCSRDTSLMREVEL